MQHTLICGCVCCKSMQNINEIKWYRDTQLNSQVSEELWISSFLFYLFYFLFFWERTIIELFDIYIYIYIFFFFFDRRTIWFEYVPLQNIGIIYFKLIQYASPQQISQCLRYIHILQICNPDWYFAPRIKLNSSQTFKHLTIHILSFFIFFLYFLFINIT